LLHGPFAGTAGDGFTPQPIEWRNAKKALELMTLVSDENELLGQFQALFLRDCFDSNQSAL
jgi:hypothetical protein